MNRFASLALALTAFFSCSCSTGFRVSSRDVSFNTWDEAHGSRRLAIQGADPATFKVLNGSYATDRKTAYFKDKQILGSQPETFVAMSEIYAKDQNHVFYQDQVVNGADPNTFGTAQDDFGRDKTDIYLHARAIQACDPPSFKWLKSPWQVDSMCAYHRGIIVKNADPKTFVPLGYFFAKDRQRVYSSVTYSAIDGADPMSFTVGSYDGSGKDKNGCYMFNKRVPCP